MHLAILTQYYPPEAGAPQARLSDLARRFVARGHRVTVLTAMPNYPEGRLQTGYGGLLRREMRDGVHVIRTFIFPSNKLDLLRRLANYFSFVLSSAVIGPLVLGAPDIILVESPPLFLGLSGAWLSRVSGARFALNVSDLWPESVVRLGKLRVGSVAHRLSLWLEARLYRKAWLVTGQAPGILGHVRRVSPSTSRYLLPNGVDPAYFSPSCRSDSAHAELGKGRGCVAMYAGTHGLAQGLEHVLDVAAAVRDLRDLAIVFVGGGPTKVALVAYAQTLGLDNVHFLPVAPRERMPTLVASADIVIVPLRTHLPGAIPSKIYEAMGCGVPVLLAADGEPARLVERTGCGLVVPPGDPGALASALRRLHGDAGLRATLGAAGRRAAEAEFDRAVIGARFVIRLEEELRGGSLPPLERGSAS